VTISFDGRVAVITGAGHGLGRCYALLLASRGARVVVNDLGGAVDGTGSSHSAADVVVEEIKAAGGEAVANYDNVAAPDTAANIVQQAVESFGKIDILINNAGILRDKSFAKISIEDFESVIDVHFLGSVYVTKAAFPLMKEQGYGRIVMTTSAAGLYGNFGQTNYGAAKLALVGLMNCLKLEGVRDNVLVNTIAPVAATRMTEDVLPPALTERLKPEDVSAAVAYLCSEQCTSTGDIIEAGAGYYARVQMVEGLGARLGDNVSPEMVAEAYEKITDMSGARGFAEASHALQAILAGN
jgi:NAD(P)-dependent dehydrogenase (short-subunit alcohol dehydrogenase family)